MKQLIALSVEGVKAIDLCVEGDKLLEEATGAVYNKTVKGVKASKGTETVTLLSLSRMSLPREWCRHRLPDVYFCQQRRRPFLASRVRFRALCLT